MIDTRSACAPAPFLKGPSGASEHRRVRKYQCSTARPPLIIGINKEYYSSETIPYIYVREFVFKFSAHAYCIFGDYKKLHQSTEFHADASQCSGLRN